MSSLWETTGFMTEETMIPFQGKLIPFLKKYEKVEIKSKKIRDNGMKFTTVSSNFEL